jgi:hypothetical protein
VCFDCYHECGPLRSKKSFCEEHCERRNLRVHTISPLKSMDNSICNDMIGEMRGHFAVGLDQELDTLSNTAIYRFSVYSAFSSAHLSIRSSPSFKRCRNVSCRTFASCRPLHLCRLCLSRSSSYASSCTTMARLRV